MRVILTSFFAVLVFASLTPASAEQWKLHFCSDRANLPFSNANGEGFENRIAEIIADELGAEAVFVIVEPARSDVRAWLLTSGACDVVMAISDGQSGYLSTLTYYRSIYSFVYRTDSGLAVQSFDDEELKDLRIGIQVARAGGISAITQALAIRGMIPNQVSFVTDLRAEDPLLELPRAVENGEVDIAVLWGPVAGYASQVLGGTLTHVPVSPQIDMPMNIMYVNITMGLRPGDTALRDDINIALANRWDEIQSVLNEYSVPLLDLPAPRLGTR